MNKGEQKQNKFLNRLLGLPDNTNINYAFNPLDSSIMKISWNSPNDGKSNMINFLLDPTDLTTIRIKDTH